MLLNKYLVVLFFIRLQTYKPFVRFHGFKTASRLKTHLLYSVVCCIFIHKLLNHLKVGNLDVYCQKKNHTDCCPPHIRTYRPSRLKLTSISTSSPQKNSLDYENLYYWSFGWISLALLWGREGHAPLLLRPV